MDANNISYARFNVILEHPEILTDIDQVDFTVIFYRGHVSSDPEGFLKTHFLNDSEMMCVPENFSAKVYLAEDEGHVDVDYFISLPGSNESLFLGTALHSNNGNSLIIEVKVSIRDILASAVGSGKIDNNLPYPARLTLKAGERVMTFFIYKERPAFALAYRNGFNLVEYFWSFGSWKRKSAIKADTAFINGLPVAYGISGDDSFELVTHKMSARSMMHGFNFIGKTPADVTLYLGREVYAFQGVLTEVDCDTDPFSDELTEIKMKATVSNSMGLMRINNSDMFDLFTNPFNISFQ